MRHFVLRWNIVACVYKPNQTKCGSDTEVGMFGVKKPTERIANLSCRFGCFTRPEKSRVGSEFSLREHRETCTRPGPEPSNEFSRVAKKMIIRFWVQGNLCREYRKPVRGVENQLAKTRLDYHNMQTSDNQYLEKVFKNLRQKLNLS